MRRTVLFHNSKHKINTFNLQINRSCIKESNVIKHYKTKHSNCLKFNEEKSETIKAQ